MNLGSLRRMLDESFSRGDLERNYVEWINRGILKIQQDDDWGPMKDVATLAISAGQSSVALPSNFKSLTTARYPVSVRRAGDSSLFPCNIVTPEDSRRLASTWYGTGQPAQVMIVEEGEAGRLELTAPAAENLEFLVSFYGFVPALVLDTDSNFLTNRYPDLTENRVKASAFARVNDADMVSGLEGLYRTLIREAKADDARRYRQGRAIRMGG